MTRMEQDLIYHIIPNLTKAIEGLTDELKRYNDNIEKKEDKHAAMDSDTK